MTQEHDSRAAKNEGRREQLISAAMNVFSRLGYDGSTMANVAAEAGVAVGTIYNYFPSKRHLLEAITEGYIIKVFRQLMEKRSGDDLEFITAIMENRLNLGLQDTGRFLALFNEIERDPELRQRYYEEALGPILRMLEGYLRHRTAEGAFRQLDPALTVRAFGGMFIGFMLLIRIEGDNTPIDLNDRGRLAREMATLVLEGIRCH